MVGAAWWGWGGDWMNHLSPETAQRIDVPGRASPAYSQLFNLFVITAVPMGAQSNSSPACKLSPYFFSFACWAASNRDPKFTSTPVQQPILKHYSMAVYRRRLKMPLKVIKMPSKTFLGMLKNACYKLDLKSLLRHFFKTPSNINI